MAISDLASGRKISVKPVPEDITYFVLAKEFNWTPDQIDRMGTKKVKKMLTMVSTYNKVINNEMKKANKKR